MAHHEFNPFRGSELVTIIRGKHAGKHGWIDAIDGSDVVVKVCHHNRPGHAVKVPASHCAVRR